MTRLGSQFIIEVDGVTTARSALGKSVTLEVDGEAWRIDLPEAADSFPFVRATVGGSENDPREYVPVSLVDSGPSLVEVRLLRLVVNFAGTLSAATYDPEGDAALFSELVHKYADKALALARDFSSRLRLELGQFWVEPTGEFPRMVGALSLVDLDAGVGFRTMIAGGGSFRVVDPGSVLTEQAMRDLEAGMAAGPLSPEEVLLSEARYLADSGHAGAPDRATLLSAIAVELGTKRVLREIAEDKSETLELLIENPRDWSMAAHGLYLKVLPLFAGQDLGDEHRASAREVQRLFMARNAIAHKGSTISREDGKSHVDTALEAFRILKKARGVRARGGAPPRLLT